MDYETNTFKIEVKGNLITILTDISYLINDIYISFLNSDPLLGEGFQCLLREEVDNDSSPVWDVLDTQKAGEHGVKGVSVRIPGVLQDLLDALRGNEHGE